MVRPLLLVGLFAPAEELSAAVMIGTLYFYGKQEERMGVAERCRGTVSYSHDWHCLLLW